MKKLLRSVILLHVPDIEFMKTPSFNMHLDKQFFFKLLIAFPELR